MNMLRRLVLAVLVVALAPLTAFAQAPQRNVPRIGFLIAETFSGQATRVEALRAGLKDRGYVEGKNFAIEFRSADGHYDRLPAKAAELTRLKVDVIVAFGSKAVLAAQHATSTIPIVVPVIGDPVAVGAAGSVARPGGNITGSATFGPQVSAKRLEFLREAVPHVTRVAYLLNPANASSAFNLQSVRDSARSLEVRAFEVRVPSDFERTFSAIANARVGAVLVSTDTLLASNAKEIADLAAAQRLPTASGKEFAEAGGLIGYGANDAELYRRASYFVDRILKGAKPSDLPIEQATRFELVINMKAAKALGIKIPQSILIRADKVIE